MITLLFIFSLATAVPQLTKFYSNDVTCSNQETLWIISEVTTCTPSSCNNLNGLTGTSVTCPSTITYPAGWTWIETWQSSITCQSTPSSIAAMPANGCSGIWTSSTFGLSCGSQSTSQGLISDCQASSSSCNGCGVKFATKGGNCTGGNPSTTLLISSYRWFCPAFTTTSTTRALTTTTTQVSTTQPADAIKLVMSFLMIFIFACLMTLA